MRKILFIAAFFLLIFSATSVQAASGCCKIIKETAVYEITAFQEVYMTMQSEDCDKQKGPNTEVTFEEGKVASADSKSCEDATGTTGESQPSKPIAPQLQVSLPGFEKFSDVTCDNPEVICEIPWIAEYIKAFYNYGLAIIGILSVIVMMIGGIIRITAGGNNAQISHGNQYIKGSILGIIFAFCSYSILFLLNPNLTILKPINVSYFGKIDLPEGFSEVINGSESSNNDSPTPQGCPDASQIIPITTSSTGAASITAEEKVWLAGSVTEFKKVVKIAQEKYGIKIRIASALRSYEHQTRLWNAALKKYGSEKAARQWVAKPSCNSPHVRGVAVDAYPVPENNTNVTKLQNAFKEAGWIRYCKEYWHFQIPGAPPQVPCSP
ncbi:MAG TPA: D-alanyl-D-alanine carboxypeptidase family protein [bacterium]|nr:D-alanyl-D-alanine carboxypeptidase family protein [bacterium]